MVNFFFESGVDLKVVDCDGCFVLYFVFEWGYLDIVSLFINLICVDVNVRDSFGKKVVDVV